MASKVRDYAKLAADIKDQVGESNIISAAHCATRLRLVLRESPSAEVTKRISEMPAVIQVVEKGGQYQIVIGTHAKDVYEELTKIMHIDESAQAGVKQGLFARIIATMSAVFAPFVYILAAAGLVQGCLIIITQFAPAFAETGTYQVLSFISWTPFTVLPPLFLVLVLSLLERWLEKHLPDVIKAIAVPFICAVIMVPLTILLIGPISDAAANGLAICYNWLAHTIPALAAVLVGGLWQIFVIFGIHWGVTPMNVANFNANHCDTFQAFQTCAVVAQAAACLGVFLKSRNKENKNVALSAGITGVFGITEPAIYGVTLRLKKPFIAGCIGGGIGAVIISLFGTQYYAYAGLPGLLTTVNAICPTDPDTLASLNLAANPTSFPGMMIGVLATIVITVVLVMVIGCGDEAPAVASDSGSDPAPAEEEAPAVFDGPVTIYAPLNGEIKLTSQVNDPTFAEGILGQGAAIIPSEGKLYAPFDCTVDSLFDTHHAINLAVDGVEMLIHIGLETVTLNGRGFTPHVKDGDKVKAGDLLIEFDLEELKKGFDTITPILVTNVDDFAAVEQLKESGTVKVGDPILTVKR